MSALTAIGNIYNINPAFNNILSSDINFSITSKAYYTSSAAYCGNYLNKAIFVGYSGASEGANLGTNSGSIVIQTSADNLWWNTGVIGTLITVGEKMSPVVSGSFSTVGNWFFLQYNYPALYIRAYVYNGSGSAVSGSIYIIGNKS